jgi:hypothetical protein
MLTTLGGGQPQNDLSVALAPAAQRRESVDDVAIERDEIAALAVRTALGLEATVYHAEAGGSCAPSL